MAIYPLTAKGYDYIEVSKKGKGENLIIISGAGGGYFWNNSVDKISKTYTCHLISIKAISGEKSSPAFDLVKLQKEIDNYLTANKIKNANIIGHSLGGYIAMKLAINSPESFSKIILVDSYPCSLAMNDPSVTSQILKAQSEYLKKYINSLSDDDFMKFWGGMSKSFFRDTTLQSRFLKIIANSDRNFLTEFQSAVIADDMRPALTGIDLPVLELSAKESLKAFAGSTEQIKQKIDSQFMNLKNYKLQINEDSGHFIMVDQNEWFTGNIFEFLSK